MFAGSRVAPLLVLALLLPVGAALADSPGAAGPAQVSSSGTNATTSIVIQMQSDGDARWTISTSFNLTTENETAAFRQLASDFEDGDTPTLGLEAYRQASELASTATGREMTITNEDRTASPESVIQNGTGRLELSFTWTNFGRVEGDRIHVDDVFQTPDGTWFPGLEPDQTLVIRAPDQFSVFDANVAPENGTLRWTGPASFGPESLTATFTGGNGSPPGDQLTLLELALWVLVGAAVLAVGAAGAYLLVKRDVDLETLSLPLSSAGEESATDDEQDDDGSAEELTEKPPEESPDEEDENLELLSDEERVEHLLQENGGRMKQANIVKETNWSNAKVSQLLSAMEEEGRIDKLRIGRENLISFPDEDLTDFED